MQRLSQTTREQWTRATRMSKGSKRRPGEGFEDSYDRIFDKNRKIQRGTWVQDENTGRMVEKADFHPTSDGLPHIQADIEPFVSPITGKAITSRSQLRLHNREHGVTDSRDYSQEHYDKAAGERSRQARGDTPEAKRERIDTINRAIDNMRGR